MLRNEILMRPSQRKDKRKRKNIKSTLIKWKSRSQR